MKRIFMTFLMAVVALQSCDDEATTQLPEEKFGKIEGIVIDQNGIPVRGATITTNPATSTATTDSLGKFTLSNVIAGSFSITATKDGSTKSQTVSVVASLTTTANFTLSVVPVNGLVAYYPFSGNADDKSGNNYNGTVFQALLTTDRFGNANGAYKFDGDNDYILVENAASTKLEPTDEMTISCFIKAESAHGKNRWSRIIKKAAAFDNGYALSWDHELNGNLQAFLAYDNIPAEFYTPNDIATTSNASLVGNWHHVLMTYAKISKTLKLYVDGALAATTADCNYTFQHSGDLFLIGGMPVRELQGKMYYETFPGSIDDVRIYDRVLNANEIDALYHEGGF
jgi:hypothetical protein